MANPLDIVLFGATGYTGIFCIKSLHKLTKNNGCTLTWGIAGRSKKKLKEAVQDYENQIGADLSSVPIIIADINDFESLKNMTARAKVVINCCGPYKSYGELVVRACLETGTHQVDVASEPLYMEMVQYKYHNAAREKNVYIVSACGFNSIIADFGVLFLQDKFGGTINSVEYYEEYFLKNSERIPTTYAAYESVVNRVGFRTDSNYLKQKLYSTPLPEYRPRLKSRGYIHKSSLINKWCIPFSEENCSVVQRTQRYLFDNKTNRPVQIEAYLGQQSLLRFIVTVVLRAILLFLAKYKFGRYLVLKCPYFYTGGYIKHKRPANQFNVKFLVTLQANGWNEKLLDVNDDFNTLPNKSMVACVSGEDSLHALTATFVTLSAIAILTDGDKLPKCGGVYTPGSAFMETSLMKMLQENGLNIEIL